MAGRQASIELTSGLEKKLPPGSEVRSRPGRYWQTHISTVLFFSLALAAETGLIALLLWQRRRMRQAEDDLSNSRETLRTVLDTIPQRVFWKDRKSVFLGCNQALATDCGFADPRELIGKTDHETVSADVADRYRADDLEVMETNRPKLNYEEPQVRAAGSLHWLRTNKAPLHDQNGRVIGVLGIYEDVTELKRSEMALRESEKRFSTVFNASSIGIIISRLDDGQIMDVNPAFANIHGYSREEMIGRTGLELKLWANPDEREEMLHRLHRDGRCSNLNVKFQRKEGQIGDLLVSVETIILNGVPCILALAREITTLKKAEEALRESEQRFRTLSAASFEGLCISENDRILDVNDQFTAIFGYDRSELIGREIISLLAPEWRQAVAERIGNGVEGSFEHEGLRKDGRIISLEAQSKTIFMGARKVRMTALRDISERKRKDEQIRQLSRAVEQSPVSVIITDRRGDIQYVNPRFSEATGYTADEVLGKNPRVLKSGELSPETYEQLWKCITSGGTWAGELHNRKKDGQLFWEQASISPIFDAAGKITHFLAIKEDITSRKQLEEQFRQSQKMEAFGQLAGGVAHDFNNLLTVIQGNITLLQQFDAAPSERAEYLLEISRAAERAANLTRQLLMFSRRQLIQPRPADLNEVVANTTKMLQRLIGEHIELATQFAPGGAPVTADRNMMEQILVNLAVNARDAMPKGGRLTIRTGNVTVNPNNLPADSKARPGEFVCLSIADTGCGIAPGQMEHIFEPFFTTKEVGKGTGLGLATVFGIVEQHHGWIEVQSQPNAGTCFQIYLPRLEQQEKVEAESSQLPAAHGGKETIFLVEDEAPVRTLTRKLLQRQGYRVVVADSGNAALKLWEQHRDTIDLLLTDMVMPEGVSGRELAEQLLREKPGLKVIYTSGYTDDMLGENSPLRDNPNFLEKPFELQKLLQRIRACLDETVGN